PILFPDQLSAVWFMQPVLHHETAHRTEVFCEYRHEQCIADRVLVHGILLRIHFRQYAAGGLRIDFIIGDTHDDFKSVEIKRVVEEFITFIIADEEAACYRRSHIVRMALYLTSAKDFFEFTQDQSTEIGRASCSKNMET